MAEEVAPRRFRDGPGPGPEAGLPWSSFRERTDRTGHRRLFVAKYNPAYWGDPWAAPSVWHSARPECWLDDKTTRDANEDREGTQAQPDMAAMMAGDRILV